MENNIKDKIVIITGASSGLGEAAAKHLASLGAVVVLGARRADKIAKLAKDIQDVGGQALAVTADVTNLEQVKNLVDSAVDQFGRIDVILNNAGIMPLSPMDRVNVEEWNTMIDVNIKGVLNGIAAVLPYMKAQKSGQIINTSSVAGHKVFHGSAVYSATKYAVRALTEGLRMEIKPYNIRTTIVCPGAAKTELLEHISEVDIQQANKDYVGGVGISPDSFARVVAFAIGQPEDVDVN
ncbi:SDR family oxidoreductase [Pedobacter sp. Leaf176]|uniref:SDR family oxidoreductase n=1 Tax=Pedobacter sp. Leaf176 TaxID=1736286 RepID=UPI0006FCDD77|nr:SDR family oxidoreductase [Pedobacter sp. Leaf176]KQR66982.1 oxidoreductase [Pedobacter sp. Leaf176]